MFGLKYIKCFITYYKYGRRGLNRRQSIVFGLWAVRSKYNTDKRKRCFYE